MIVAKLYADNFAAFNKFEINFTYKKKNTSFSSLISNEFLSREKKFNYKKINIIYGENASGKTSLGKLLCHIFNFIFYKRDNLLLDMVNDETKPARFILYFICDNENLTALEGIIENKKIKTRYSKIKVNDNFQNLSFILEKQINQEQFSTDYSNLQYFSNFGGWNFVFPSTEDNILNLDFIDSEELKEQYKITLSLLLPTFDKNIVNVERSKDSEEAYVIYLKNNKKIIIQNKMEIDSIPILSSGTKYAIKIASILIAIRYNIHGFYYVDEQFSYTSSELENVLLSLMINYLPDDSQLFFTTHNLELLNKLLPKHSYIILKQNEDGNSCPIYAESLNNKNNQSLKNLYSNDYFNNHKDTTNIDKLYEI